MFALYDRVRIKNKNITGNIVSTSSSTEEKECLYFVEVDDEYKDGDNDLIWCESNEIELV